VAATLGTRHAETAIGAHDVAAVFPAVIEHCETPLVRTAPAPMYLLARLTREHGIAVVLTGEGSDEIFLGYDLFKETVLRRFCARRPESKRRPRLFERLYPYLGHDGRGGELWGRWFLDAGATGDPLASHMPRFLLTSRIKDFYRDEVRDALAGTDVLADLRAELPAGWSSWSEVERAAWLETSTLLSGYLLSSQGDRVALAHGLEGRFPFLDHRLFSFAASLPVRSRLRGLKEKDILRRWARERLPPSMPAPGQAALSRAGRRGVLRRGPRARVSRRAARRARAREGRAVRALRGGRARTTLPLRARDRLPREPGAGRGALGTDLV
jgi:asparagine synthase (glutamine-hydrolysing)